MHVDVRFHFDQVVDDPIDDDEEPYVHVYVSSVEHLESDIDADTKEGLHESLAQSDYWVTEISWKTLKAMFEANAGQKIEICSRY